MTKQSIINKHNFNDKGDEYVLRHVAEGRKFSQITTDLSNAGINYTVDMECMSDDGIGYVTIRFDK